MKRVIFIAATAMCLVLPSLAQTQPQKQKEPITNKYADALAEPTGIKGDIVRAVVVTVDSAARKQKTEYATLIPSYPYQPTIAVNQSVPAGLLDVTARINEAVEQAKKERDFKTVITITIQQKDPKFLKSK